MKPKALLSYAHLDDADASVTELRTFLSHEVRRFTGSDFQIFQDKSDIDWGENWRKRFEEILDEVTFLIPIITPSFLNSDKCRAAVQLFLDHEQQLGRNDLILPIYYVESYMFDDERENPNDEVVQALRNHLFVDWRDLRGKSWENQEVRGKLEGLARMIRDALHRVKAAGGQDEFMSRTEPVSLRQAPKHGSTVHVLRTQAEQPPPQQPDDLSSDTIFISYDRDDWDEFVQPLVIDLRQRGFKVWIDQQSIRHGSNWRDAIQEALEACDRMVLCVSPNSMQSAQTKMEYRYFLNMHKTVIPLVIREARMLYDLASIQFVSYEDQNLLVQELLTE